MNQRQNELAKSTGDVVKTVVWEIRSLENWIVALLEDKLVHIPEFILLTKLVRQFCQLTGKLPHQLNKGV